MQAGEDLSSGSGGCHVCPKPTASDAQKQSLLTDEPRATGKFWSEWKPARSGAPNLFLQP